MGTEKRKGSLRRIRDFCQATLLERVPRSLASSFFIGKISSLQLDQPGTHSFPVMGGVSLPPDPTGGGWNEQSLILCPPSWPPQLGHPTLLWPHSGV